MMSFISLYGTSEHSIGWLTILLDASIKSGSSELSVGMKLAIGTCVFFYECKLI